MKLPVLYFLHRLLMPVQARTGAGDMQLKEIIHGVKSKCCGAQISVGSMVDSFQQDIFGVLLLIASSLIVLPITFIPGISFVCSVIVLWTAFHVLTGRQELWLPQRIRDIHLSSRKVSWLLEKLHSMVQKSEGLFKPRLRFLTAGLAEKLSAGIGMVLAAVTILLGFVPLLNILLMTPIMFFALGACTGDGLMTCIGWTVIALCVGVPALML
jgi:hypothetical protein